MTLEEPIDTKQILNQIESAVKDLSNVKEKHMETSEDYKNIKLMIEQLQSKTKELKLQIDTTNEDADKADWQKQNLSLENTNKKLEKCKSEFEQLKKGKQTPQVSL